jgi:hypothetical protein
MNKSKKLFIGIIVILLIICAGFLLLPKPNGAEETNVNSYQDGSPLDHTLRPFLHGGVPGDGGGG